MGAPTGNRYTKMVMCFFNITLSVRRWSVTSPRRPDLCHWRKLLRPKFPVTRVGATSRGKGVFWKMGSSRCTIPPRTKIPAVPQRFQRNNASGRPTPTTPLKVTKSTPLKVVSTKPRLGNRGHLLEKSPHGGRRRNDVTQPCLSAQTQALARHRVPLLDRIFQYIC